MNNIYPWGHERPCNTYSNFIKNKFGARIQKISVHANFTCPNRDGKLGVGGCAFCNNDAFVTSYCTPEHGIPQQIRDGKMFVKRRYRRATNYFAYFQAYSNTYASLDSLIALFEEIKKDSEIVGFIIGTRPDCIDDEKLAYFAQLSQEYYVVLEYGVESIYDKTLEYVNRGHTYEVSKQAIIRTAEFGIPVGVHIILGFPGETPEMMMHMATEISTLPIHSIKLHQLQIVKGTRFAQEYADEPSKFQLFTPDTYIPFVAEFVTHLSSEILIERFAGDSPERVRIAPVWEGVKYESFVQLLEDYMITHNLWQGKNYIKQTVVNK